MLQRFRKRVDPRAYNGASLLGLNGIVIKSHGSADAMSLENAIHIAVLECHARVTESIRDQVEAHLLPDVAANLDNPS